MKNNLLYIIILTFLIACSFNNQTKSTESISIINNDTSLLKTIKWDSLNENIQYHFTRNANKSADSNTYYSIKLLALYQYLECNYEYPTIDTGTILNPKPDTAIILNANQLNEFIMSDFFKGKNDFECLLKVNSKIGFKSRPDLLEWFLIFPDNSNDKDVMKLISELKKQRFTNNANLITQESVLGSGVRKAIRVNLKPNYFGLLFRKEIEDSIFNKYGKIDLQWADFYTGYNEQDLFYSITSVQKSSR